jgi:hypothetical protein
MPDSSSISTLTAAVPIAVGGGPNQNEESHLMRWLSKSIIEPGLQTSFLFQI